MDEQFFDFKKSRQNFLVLGGQRGLLGQALVYTLRNRGYAVHAQGRNEVNVLDMSALEDFLLRVRPSVVFNAVAYTKVDQAEQEQSLAYKLNRDLVRFLAVFCRKQGVFLVHFSTDFVFAGDKNSPYSPADSPSPLSVYGRSKLAGEQAIFQCGLENFLIIRTAWLFGPGRDNFVSKMLSLAKEHRVLRVVHDQVGSPTYTLDLAGGALALMDAGARGIYHMANSGQASWCELAAEALKIAGYPGQIVPITSADYPQPAPRPAYSVLDLSPFVELTGLIPRPWPQALRAYLFREAGDRKGGLG